MKLWNYIKGDRKGRDAHLLEKDAMKDPFLADALEGFDAVDGNHSARIERLRKEVKRKSATRTNYLKVCAVAAGILFIAGTGGYFLMRKADMPPDRQFLSDAMEECILPLSPTAPIVSVETEGREEMAQNRQPNPSEESAMTVGEDFDDIPPPPPPPDLSSIPQLLVVEDVVSESIASTEDTQVTSVRQIAKAEVAEKSAPLASVRGQVVDAQGEPVIGALVRVGATTNGTITNEDGYFELRANNNEILRISHIGYAGVSLPVDTGNRMLIAMRDDRVLAEVVVTEKDQPKRDASKEPVPVMGKKAFANYLKENLRRPDDDNCRNAKGKVTLRFYVNHEGRPYNITVSKGLCQTADAEAVRLINEGPDWELGSKEVKVEVKF